ncbi:MAG: hypothetical protein DDT29_00896 [Dehalococcoidia bacterium]|nr:hypothetical protein [Bacillota bacterium]
MRNGLLTAYMEAGIPHLRHASRLPEGLLPDFTNVARTLGDEAMLEIAEPLGLCDSLKSLLAQAPEPDSLPVEIWKQAISCWQASNQVLPVTMALLWASEKVEALERRGVLVAGVASIVRSLATIAYATFDPSGIEILDRLAGILGGSPAQPAELLERYVKALKGGDHDTLARVGECILQNAVWAEWSERFLVAGEDFPFVPRVIGMSPPLTSGLKQVLINMVMEVLNAHDSRNYRN